MQENKFYSCKEAGENYVLLWKITKPYTDGGQCVLIRVWCRSLTVVFIISTVIFLHNDDSFFLIYIMLYAYIIKYLSILPLMDIWIISGFGCHV